MGSTVRLYSPLSTACALPATEANKTGSILLETLVALALLGLSAGLVLSGLRSHHKHFGLLRETTQAVMQLENIQFLFHQSRRQNLQPHAAEFLLSRYPETLNCSSSAQPHCTFRPRTRYRKRAVAEVELQ